MDANLEVTDETVIEVTDETVIGVSDERGSPTYSMMISRDMKNKKLQTINTKQVIPVTKSIWNCNSKTKQALQYNVEI